MGAHEIAKEHRARLAGRGVAHRDGDIQRWRLLAHELVPGLARQAIDGHASAGQLLQCIGIHLAGGLAAGAKGNEPALAQVVEGGFRQDAPGGIAGADEEDATRVHGEVS